MIGEPPRALQWDPRRRGQNTDRELLKKEIASNQIKPKEIALATVTRTLALSARCIISADGRMDQRLKLSIGAWNTESPAQPVDQPIHSDPPVEGNVTPQATPTVDHPAAPAGEALAQIYQVLKRHEETLRDLVVEIRLLYHNLPEKDRQRLEAQRERTTREVHDLFAGEYRVLEESISRAQRLP